jgi:hypothetical protein
LWLSFWLCFPFLHPTRELSLELQSVSYFSLHHLSVSAVLSPLLWFPMLVLSFFRIQTFVWYPDSPYSQNHIEEASNPLFCSFEPRSMSPDIKFLVILHTHTHTHTHTQLSGEIQSQK